MEIDTGAFFSIISETQKSMVPLLNTYTKEPIPVLGQLNVEVRYGQQQATLPLVYLIPQGQSPSPAKCPTKVFQTEAHTLCTQAY